MGEEEKRAIPLRKVRVENFGCLRDVTVELEPLTVLVGPNDSGKSTFLRPLENLAAASQLEKGWSELFPTSAAVAAQTFNGDGDPIRLRLEGATDSSPHVYETMLVFEYGTTCCWERLDIGELHIEKDQKGTRVVRGPTDEGTSFSGGPYQLPLLHPYYSSSVDRAYVAAARPAEPLLASLRGIRLYSLRPENLREPSAPSSAQKPSLLDVSGLGLPLAIANLLLSGRDILERIEKALVSAMPHVRRIDVKQNAYHSGKAKVFVYDLELVTRSGARIPSHAISDGVLLFLGYLYLVLGPDPASILLIEEPETGIHPGLLRRLMQLFRDMTTGAHGGPPTQIIITTHSPLLLNLVQPEEIRVFQRGEDGATTVMPFMSAPDIEKLLDYQGPGEIWINEGEEYLVGKQRS